MTVEAVAVLQTIARDEFERDWHDSEDFNWVEGWEWDDPPVPAVTEIKVELEGKTYTFATTNVLDKDGRVIRKGVVDEIKGWVDYYRWEFENEVAEEEDDEPNFHFDPSRYYTEEMIEEEIWQRVHQHFVNQLDSAEEALAVFQTRADYMVKGFEEIVAMFHMVGERVPELRPVLQEKLQEAHAQVVATLQRWIDENGEEGAETS